jgi:hypothetical protein
MDNKKIAKAYNADQRGMLMVPLFPYTADKAGEIHRQDSHLS